MNQYSYSAEFAAAMAADTCWVTPNAKANGERNPVYPHEVWVETLTVHRFRKHVGALPVGTNPNCAANQFRVVAAQTDALIARGYDPNLKRPKG